MAVWFQSMLIAALAVVSASVAEGSMPLMFLVFSVTFAIAWLCGLGPKRIRADNRRVLIRSWFTSSTTLEEGTFWLWFPEYVVGKSSAFGPWAGHANLPAKGQIREVDVPEALIPVEGGTYALRVNTKVVGHVTDYSVQDLLLNPIAIEDQMRNVIVDALRSAVHDMPLEEALTKIQEILSDNALNFIKELNTPTFVPSRLMLDADQHIEAANSITKHAMDLVAQRKQEVARRSMQAEAHATALQELENKLALQAEEQRQAHIMKTRELQNQQELKADEQKVHAMTLKMRREELMLEREVYGSEGAAQIQATKHAKAAYLLSGNPYTKTDTYQVVTSLP